MLSMRMSRADGRRAPIHSCDCAGIPGLLASQRYVRQPLYRLPWSFLVYVLRMYAVRPILKMSSEVGSGKISEWTRIDERP
jgi:hypothetical protein